MGKAPGRKRLSRELRGGLAVVLKQERYLLVVCVRDCPDLLLGRWICACPQKG